MNRLERSLGRLDADLRALDLRWALVGGLAVSIRAQPRITWDVDVAVAGRARDLEDCRALLARASTWDLRQAMDTLDLIERRGFHRGKDLPADFARIRQAR